MKKLFWLLGVVVILFSGCVATQGGGGNGGNEIQPEPRPKKVYPKLAAYWQSPFMTESTAKKLAEFDLVIVDPENRRNNSGSIDKIRRLNPSVVLIPYWNIMELFDPQVSGRPLQNWLYRVISTQYSQYWLSTPDGKPNYYWMQPRMRMLNLSSKCPKVNGLRYSEYIANLLIDSVLSDKIYNNGFFSDNLWDDVSFVNPGKIDANNDGITDNPNGWQLNLPLDRWWREGIKAGFSKVVAVKGKSFIFIGNEPNTAYADLTKGKMYENFPCSWIGGLEDNIEHYLKNGTDYTIIHIAKSDYQRVRLVLGITLLGSGYFCYDYNNTTWFDEFDVDLGNPIGVAMKVGNAYARNFEKGVVMVTTSKSAQVAVGSGFKKVDGTQTSSVSLNTFDGAILVGKKGNLQGTPIFISDKKEYTITSDRAMKHVISDMDNWEMRSGLDNVYKGVKPATHYVNVEDLNGLWACDSRGTHFGVYVNGVKLTRTVDNNQGGRNFVFTINSGGSVSP